MHFKDMYVNIEEQFSLGVEVDSGKFYLSIPVSNGLVEYEEYYEIDEEDFQKICVCFESIKSIALKCKAHELDNKLIEKPGRLRGEPI